MDRFEAKGLAFVGALSFAERLEGGRAAVEAAMEPSVRARLEDIYISSGWYDVEVLVALMNALSQVAGVEPQRMIERHAGFAARKSVEGMHRHSMQADSAREMAERLPRAFNRHFRPCEAKLRDARRGSMSATLAPIPERFEDFYRAMNDGFVKGALEVAGAQGAAVRWTDRRPLDDGTLELTFEALWS